MTDEAETDMICSAIYHHDDKLATDDPMDEVLKDADVIDHCFKDASKPVKEKEQVRYDKLCGVGSVLLFSGALHIFVDSIFNLT